MSHQHTLQKIAGLLNPGGRAYLMYYANASLSSMMRWSSEVSPQVVEPPPQDIAPPTTGTVMPFGAYVIVDLVKP